MTFLQKDVGNDAPTVDRDGISRCTDLHPAIATLEIDFGYTANQNLFHQLQVRCKILSDLKANSITISGCPCNREGLLEVCMRKFISPNDNDRRLTSCSPVDLRHWITHPKLTTDERRFGYRGFKRKVSFFGLDGPSMPNPGGIHIFHGASDVGSADVTVKKVWRFRPVDRRGTAPVALHNKTALIDQDLFIDNVSSMTPATASISPSA